MQIVHAVMQAQDCFMRASRGIKSFFACLSKVGQGKSRRVQADSEEVSAGIVRETVRALKMDIKGLMRAI